MCVNVFLDQPKLKFPARFTKRFWNPHFLHAHLHRFRKAKHIHSTFSGTHKSKAHRAEVDSKGEGACPNGGMCKIFQ